MSPARSKRQAEIPHHRGRTEIVKAVAVGVGIVIATAIFVWLMRPGPPGIPGTGGLINRQPRSSWLVGFGLGAAGLATWWILRYKRSRAKILLPIALVGILIATVVGGFLWPGGLLRHEVAPEPVPTPDTSTTTPAPPSTTGAGGSGGSGAPAGGSGGSGPASGAGNAGPSATTVPATTIPATTTPPTTGSP